MDATQTELVEAVKPFVTALYSQDPGTSMEAAWFNLFTRKKKSPNLMALPPTSGKLLQHTLRAHLQVMLWKAADQQGPPAQSTNITQFGWEIKDGIRVPAVAQGDPAPPELINVIRCQCKVQGKKCSTMACGCHKEHIACTSYCNCGGNESCNNPFTMKQALKGEELEQDTEENMDLRRGIMINLKRKIMRWSINT